MVSSNEGDIPMEGGGAGWLGAAADIGSASESSGGSIFLSLDEGFQGSSMGSYRLL
jgi:hypothetical protein